MQVNLTVLHRCAKPQSDKDIKFRKMNLGDLIISKIIL